MRTETITTRVDPAIKKAAAAVFKPLGLTTSEAINIFLHKSVDAHGIPFDVRRTPTKALQADIRAARTRKGGKTYTDFTDYVEKNT